MSLVFTLQEHHIIMFALYGDDIGMTSLCSHHILIALMMSLHSDHDIIVTCVNHNCSHGT